jgi:site-specific recombinase XerD
MNNKPVLGSSEQLFRSAFSGMSREEALAFISRLYDAQAAGAKLWSDSELIHRFLQQCSRTGSNETIRGYGRDLRSLVEWLDIQCPGKPLRCLDPALAENAVDDLRTQVQQGVIAQRTFNRRFAAWSSLYQWASEPCRSPLSGVTRNPLPRKCFLTVPRTSRALTGQELERVLDVIADAAREGDPVAARDYIIVRLSYLIGCRVSELARLRWEDIEPLTDGAQVHLLGKGSKRRTVRVSAETLALIEALGRREPKAWLFPSRRKSGPMSRQAIGDRLRIWGECAGVSLHHNKLRHSHATHAIRSGVDVFTLQRTLGHSSVATTAIYVATEPSDSSSLRLQ